MASELTFQTFLEIGRRNWRTIAGVGVIAAVLSIILSGPTFMVPRYKSMATVYPVNLNSYSIETRTEQLLQLLESNSIRDSLINRYDLATVYDVDTAANGGYFALYNEFDDRVDIDKTRYESVRIEIVDEDPMRARDMVSEMLRQVNLFARALQREKSYEVLKIATRSLDHERNKMDSVEAQLNIMRREAGLLSYDLQVKELTKGYVRMLGSGAGQGQKDQIQGMIRELEEKGGEFKKLTDLSIYFRQNYDRLLTEHERVVNDVTKELTYTNVVVYPEVSDKKVYPVRWLIVSTVTTSALFLCFLLLVWRDQRS